jgi:hypothetical protein
LILSFFFLLWLLVYPEAIELIILFNVVVGLARSCKHMPNARQGRGAQCKSKNIMSAWFVRTWLPQIRAKFDILMGRLLRFSSYHKLAALAFHHMVRRPTWCVSTCCYVRSCSNCINKGGCFCNSCDDVNSFERGWDRNNSVALEAMAAAAAQQQQ